MIRKMFEREETILKPREGDNAIILVMTKKITKKIFLGSLITV